MGDLVPQRTADEVVHHVIRSPILLEHVQNADDMGMIQRGDQFRLTNELAEILQHQRTVRLDRHIDLHGIRYALARVLHEELLQRNLPSQIHLLRFVRDSEPALTERANDAVFAVL